MPLSLGIFMLLGDAGLFPEVVVPISVLIVWVLCCSVFLPILDTVRHLYISSLIVWVLNVVIVVFN